MCLGWAGRGSNGKGFESHGECVSEHYTNGKGPRSTTMSRAIQSEGDGAPSSAPYAPLHLILDSVRNVKRKTISVEKAVRQYALSTVKGSLNFAEHFAEQGYTSKHATKNAVNYGIKMLEASVGIDNVERVASDLRSMAVIAGSLADYLERKLSR